MRQKTLVLLCLLLLGPCLESRAQALSTDQVEDLYRLAQVWSTAKNYHSGTCRQDWDAQLLDSIPAVLAAGDAAGFNEELAILLGGLGANEVRDQPLIETPQWLAQARYTGWLQDPRFNDSNRAWLVTVINEFRPRSNCHVGLGEVGQPSFIQDDGYFEFPRPDAPMRLLALFRYWNIIDTYFPYKNLISESWHQILMEFIPRVYAADDRVTYQKVMREMTARIQDSHAFFSSPYFDALGWQRYLPFVLKTVEGKLVIYKHEDSSLLGAEVLRINGRPVSELVEDYALLVSASNPSTTTREIDGFLNRGEGEARLRVRKNDAELTITTSYELTSQTSLLDGKQAFYSMDQQECSIGYVDMGRLSRQQVPGMMAEFNRKDALIFDLRNYPNSTLWTLVNYLFETPIQIATFAVPEILSPGQFKVSAGTIGSFNGNSIYEGRVLILMNEETQSQAEYTVMGLERHPGAVKIGSQTSAADGNISEIRLPGNIRTFITALGVYYPDRTPTQRVGIVPDLFVRPTITGVARGVDEVLESALNCGNILDSDWPPAVEPTPGLYWDPDKSGKGIDIHGANGNHVVYIYDFREDGSPVWYQGFADSQASKLSLTEGAFFEYEFDYATGTLDQRVPEFDMRMDFRRGIFEIPCAVSSPELQTSPAQLLWNTPQGQEMRCIEKMRFSLDEAAPNYTGLWHGGSDDDGWGFSVNHEGEVMVVIVYFYNDAGQAIWAIGSGVRNGDEPLTMGLLKVTGFCITCDTQDVQFENLGNLTLSLTDSTGDGAGSNWISLELSPESPWNRERMPLYRLTPPIQ